MKNSEKIIIVLTILLIISITTICILFSKLNMKKSNNNKNSNILISTENSNEKFKKDYEKLNNVSTEDGENTYNTVNIDTKVSIIYISIEELNELLNSNDAIIYVGSPTCPFCRTSIQPLLEVMEKLGLSTLYYYYNDLNAKKSENYDSIMNNLIDKDIVKVRENGTTSFGMPLVLKIKDGNIDKNVRGVTYQIDENQNEYDEITEDQRKIVYDRYYENLK